MLALPAWADSLRLAVVHSDLSRDGPGLLLRDLDRGAEDARILAALIAEARPDVLLLLRFDHDLERRALSAFADLLAGAGLALPHRFSALPNSGLPSGFDLDGDGRFTLDDAQGYGGFSGARGMAILSRHPLDLARVRDHSGYLWADLPGASFDLPPAARAHQRLASTAYWEVPVILPSGARLTLLAWHAGTPAFGRVPGRNLQRNQDENLFWVHYLNGALPFGPAPEPFVLIGNSNLDPDAGGGLRAAMRALLDHPALSDPGGAAALPTSRWEGLGALRTSYILPARSLSVQGHGTLWPPSGRHALVWMDLAPP